MIIHPRQRHDVRSALANQQIVSMTVGPTNRLLLLSHESPSHPDEDGSMRYSCTLVDHLGQASWTHTARLRLTSCHELPRDRLLYVAARGSQRHPNGRIMRARRDGERDIFLGDGIASLQVAPSGIIWVGYFDEGLFGNEGWLHPNGGVRFVALNDHGAVVYPLGDQITAAFPRPVDSCRVNVVHDEEVWYVYEHRWGQQYPVVTISPDRVHHVGDFTQEGYRHIAVGTTYLLAVNVFTQPHSLHLFSRIPSDPWRPVHECTVHAADGHSIQGVTYAARGSMLWILADGWVYGIDVNAL
jgi:hypothetical protein